jgi:hypothetical protein
MAAAIKADPTNMASVSRRKTLGPGTALRTVLHDESRISCMGMSKRWGMLDTDESVDRKIFVKLWPMESIPTRGYLDMVALSLCGLRQPGRVRGQVNVVGTAIHNHPKPAPGKSKLTDKVCLIHVFSWNSFHWATI